MQILAKSSQYEAINFPLKIKKSPKDYEKTLEVVIRTKKASLNSCKIIEYYSYKSLNSHRKSQNLRLTTQNLVIELTKN
jgi:hypothetical protein